MRSARSKLLFLCFLLSGIFFVSQVFALEEGSAAKQSQSDLGAIKARLAVLEEQQKEIIAKEDKILEELAIVKIWVHRK